jgi:hypothetical protein
MRARPAASQEWKRAVAREDAVVHMRLEIVEEHAYALAIGAVG